MIYPTIKLTILELTVESTITTVKSTDEWFDSVFDAIEHMHVFADGVNGRLVDNGSNCWYIESKNVYTVHVHITLTHIPNKTEKIGKYNSNTTTYWEKPDFISNESVH